MKVLFPTPVVPISAMINPCSSSSADFVDCKIYQLLQYVVMMGEILTAVGPIFVEVIRIIDGTRPEVLG